MDKPHLFLTGTPRRQAAELMGRAVFGEPVSALEAAAAYANPANWRRVHAPDEDGDPRCYWAWAGPTVCGYELAAKAVGRALEERDAAAGEDA